MEDNKDLLGSIVKKILLELFEAQKASNEASAKLVEEYLKKKKPGPIEFFPIPNSSIKSFDFSLKFLLKELPVVLSVDLKERLFGYLFKTWRIFLRKMSDRGILSRSARKKLENAPPDFNNLDVDKEGIVPDPISISQALELHIKHCFSSAVKDFVEENNAYLDEIFQELNMAARLNELIFNSADNNSIPLSRVKAHFDLGKLNDIDEELICGININVEMRNFDSAYMDEITEDDPGNTIRKLLALRNGK